MPFADICGLEAVLRLQRIAPAARLERGTAGKGYALLGEGWVMRQDVPHQDWPHQDWPHQISQTSRLMVVSWVSGCSRLGCRLETQIEEGRLYHQIPVMSCQPFWRFGGATSESKKSLIVDFDFDPAVFCASIDGVIWLNRA